MLNKSRCKSCCKFFYSNQSFLIIIKKTQQLQLFFSETNNETFECLFFFDKANANEHEVISDKLFLQNQGPSPRFFPAIFCKWFTPPRELPLLVLSVYFPFLIAGPALSPKTARLPNH